MCLGCIQLLIPMTLTPKDVYCFLGSTSQGRRIQLTLSRALAPTVVQPLGHLEPFGLSLIILFASPYSSLN